MLLIGMPIDFDRRRTGDPFVFGQGWTLKGSSGRAKADT